jgi:CRISPR-associated protein Cmr6
MIPLAKDTRESIGAFAEKVENRSLLFTKMVLSKTVLHDVNRFDDAQRFNVLRATHEGEKLLQDEAASARNSANRGGINAAACSYKADVASALSSIRVDNLDLAASRIRSNNRFLLDLEASYSDRAVTFVASLGGRLLINMAGGVMENSGMALDRITGLPYIPGTAVKGITRNCALWEIRNESDTSKQILMLRHALAIFGFSPNDLARNGDFLWVVKGDHNQLDSALQGFNTDTYKGICSFIAAQPTSTENLRIVAEVLTPHFDNNLRPIFFPAVDTGAAFGFAIIGQRKPHVEDLTRSMLLNQARAWLQLALIQNGIGAKTGAGYGWFQMDPQAEEKRRIELEEERKQIELDRIAAAKKVADDLEAKQIADEAAKRLASLSPEDRAVEDIKSKSDQEFADFAKHLGDKPDYEQRAFFKVLLGPNKETRKRWKKNKPDIWNPISAIAASLKIELP